MPLQLYNTLTRSKQEFVPLDAGHVRMYVCGPTVYDYAHIGNARPVVVFDVLYRLLKRLYPRITYVRNITDVDDKIIEAARQSGEPIDRITARTAQAYHEDMAALGALPPDVEPRATQHIPQMIMLIAQLIARGHAYAADGHVLFHVPSDPDYGVLSGRNRDEQIAGARVEVAPYKRDPADFVLWKPAAPDEPGWDSPWGRGRPGWHIECSAMSAVHLGATFDIHGGGLDLIFPHHENEIAQSTCAHGTPIMARYWVHNGYVVVNGEKMSKSLGNFFTVRQLLEEFPGWGEAIRLTLLSAHYRQPLDFTKEKLAESKRRLDAFYTSLRQSSTRDTSLTTGLISPAQPGQGVQAALEDDLNTPLALSELNTQLSALNELLHRKADPGTIAQAKASLIASGEPLGLLQADPELWFKGQPKSPTALSDAEIEALICRRAAARKERNYAEADRIRKDLATQGVLLEDGPLGTIWKRTG